MVRPVRMGAKVQAWRDKEGREHAVAFKNEPHRLLCKRTGMWGYNPRLALLEDISCPECRKQLYLDI